MRRSLFVLALLGVAATSHGSRIDPKKQYPRFQVGVTGVYATIEPGPAVTVDGSATHVPNPSGSGALTLTAPTLDGTGVVVISGSGALTLTAPTLDGTATTVTAAAPTGTGAITTQAASVLGLGTVTARSDGGLVAKPFPSPWPAPPTHITGHGALTLSAPLVSGVGDNVENEDWLLLF